MNASDVPLLQFMDGARQFVIPIFQRDYSWRTQHCTQLWNDVLRAGRDPNAKAHFMGSVVYIGAEDNSADVPRWLVIDGQQRLTTVTLLFVALRDHLKTLPESEVPPTAEMLEDRFLINRHARGDRRAKLALRRGDHETLTALVGTLPDPAAASVPIKENYRFFRDQLTSADVQILWKGLQKLVVVHVSLVRGQDDPQLIFESLNSTGLELTQADLIRNFVLMRLDEGEQSRLYLKYWHAMEQSFGGRYRTDFDKFVRDYLTLELRPSKQLRSDQIYQHFRSFFLQQTTRATVEEVLARLQRFAKHFVAYSLGRETNPRLKEVFSRLQRLADVATPVMLQLYECYRRENVLAEDDFVEATELLESYVFRRSVCDMQTRNLGQIFATIAYRIKPEQPLLSLKVTLARQGKNRRFPSDVEFRDALAARDVYAMRGCHYLLDRLENDSKERIDTSTFSVEHVMPQNADLVREWRVMLGENWKAIQERWLHRLGNLTLTAYNSTYSDRPFTEKKTIANGFNDSPLRLNRYVREREAWTASEIEERGRLLAEKAVGVWKPLKVDLAAVREAELADLKARAASHTFESLEMNGDVRTLFAALRQDVAALGSDVIELFGAKTATYRVFDFFLEVIPRRDRLTLLLNLEIDECDPLPENAWDTAQRQFVIHATQEAGVAYTLYRASDVPAAMRLVRLAYEKVAE